MQADWQTSQSRSIRGISTNLVLKYQKESSWKRFPDDACQSPKNNSPKGNPRVSWPLAVLSIYTRKSQTRIMVDNRSEYSIQNPTIGKRLLWPCIQFPWGGRTIFRREHLQRLMSAQSFECQGGQMLSKSSYSGLGSVRTILLMMLALCVVPSTWAQHGSEGTVTVSVVDPTGGAVQGARLELLDLTSGDIHTAVTGDRGTYSFVNLPLGKFSLTITQTGFEKEVFKSVVSQAAQTTDIKASLKVGAATITMEVNASATPVVEESSNAIGTTVDLKQIEDLPIEGRDLTQLSYLVPGSSFVAGAGTYDGLPAIAQGNNIDGVIGSSSRMKFGGNAAPVVSPRLESIQEMTVQTEQLNLDQGYGQANMQLNFVTRRGSNAFHGRIYDDFQNDALNANSWFNDASTALGQPTPKNLLHINDFGASVGGPAIKDKLFFFGSYAERKIPGSYTTSNNLFTAAAQAGNFTYNGQTVNLFTLAQNYNTANPGANLPTSVLNCAAAYCPSTVLTAINSSTSAGQVIPSATGDPNLNQINWQVNNAQGSSFPCVRVDYNATEKMRFNLAWNMTQDNFPGINPPDFPGAAFSKTGAG